MGGRLHIFKWNHLPPPGGDAPLLPTPEASLFADPAWSAPRHAKPAAPASTGPDLNSLREQGRACIKAGKNAEMKAALTELGADSITTMDPAKYGELAAKLAASAAWADASPATRGGAVLVAGTTGALVVAVAYARWRAWRRA